MAAKKLTVAKLLTKLGIYGELREIFKIAFKGIQKKNISMLEVNIQRDIYRYVGSREDKTEEAMKAEVFRLWKEYDKNIAKKYFDVKCKMTIKRLVMLMINELDK